MIKLSTLPALATLYCASRITRALDLGGMLRALPAFAPAAYAQDCDRACMEDLITQYVDALVSRDHTSLPLADEVKYTVDGQAATLGEGLWETVTDKQSFRQDYLDTEKQVAASHVA